LTSRHQSLDTNSISDRRGAKAPAWNPADPWTASDGISYSVNGQSGFASPFAQELFSLSQNAVRSGSRQIDMEQDRLSLGGFSQDSYFDDIYGDTQSVMSQDFMSERGDVQSQADPEDFTSY